jgi:hypothetical protein
VIGKVEGCHKIGRSENVPTRLAQLDSLPVPLALIGVVATVNSTWLEKYLHVAFARHRARGEWFRLSDTEVGWILASSDVRSESDLHPEISALYRANRKPPRERKKTGRGRPRTRPENAVALRCEMSKADHALVAEAAQLTGVPISAFARAAVVEACRELEGKKRG